MKKITALILCFLITAFSVVPALASTENETETVYFEDGSYMETGINYDDSDVSAEESTESTVFDFIKFLREIIKKILVFLGIEETEKEPGQDTAEKTVNKTKYASYYDSKGVLLWKACLNAKFSYDGTVSECESVQAYCTVFDSDWSLVSKSCSKSGNSATGTFTVRQQKLGVSLKTIEKTLTLVCDENGNVS